MILQTLLFPAFSVLCFVGGMIVGARNSARIITDLAIAKADIEQLKARFSGARAPLPSAPPLANSPAKPATLTSQN